MCLKCCMFSLAHLIHLKRFFLYAIDEKNAEIVNFLCVEFFFVFFIVAFCEVHRKIAFYSLYCEFIVMTKMQMCLFQNIHLGTEKNDMKREEDFMKFFGKWLFAASSLLPKKFKFISLSMRPLFSWKVLSPSIANYSITNSHQLLR